ncbi:MAG: response regulator transcription factor [Acidimicrobiales bacterium]
MILLDLMLPRISGIDVCRDIRTKSRVPIIMVTAKSSEIDVVVGLEVGADDYITKPYRMRELIARMRAVMRRSDDVRDDADRTPDEVLEVGDVRMDRASHEVFVRDEKVALPLKEYELLSLLLENAGRVLARDTLIDRAWGHDYVGDTKTLDVHIKRLRGKIEDNPSQPVRIVTVRGVGYKFERTAP